MIDSEDRLYLGGDSLERDKFSSAILGINAKDNTIVYSVDKIIEIFVLEDDMTAEERGLERAAKNSGKPVSSFTYDPLTNSTKLI